MFHIDRSKRPGYANPQPWATRYDANLAKYGRKIKPRGATR